MFQMVLLEPRKRWDIQPIILKHYFVQKYNNKNE